MKVLTAPEARIAKVIGQAAFPREADGLPDGIEARLVEHLDDILASALPFERAQLRGLLQLFDRGFAAWAGRPTARLVDAHLDEVTDYLRSWEDSPQYLRRMTFEALRSILLMSWFGSDKVNQAVGLHAAPDPEAPMPWLRRIAEGMDALQAQAEVRAEAPPEKPLRFMGRPEGLFEHGDYKGDIKESTDVLVVGSGPGGAIVAWQLALAGRRVILVEAGPVARRDDLLPDAGRTMSRLMWDSGMRTTRGNIIAPTMQAKVLGGGSVINSAICLRASPGALAGWAEDHGVEGLSADELAPHYDAVEAFMGVRPVDPEVMGPRNRLFALGAAGAGLKAVPILRNEEGCMGSGTCLMGCRNGAKLSHDRRGLPELLALGGRVYTGVEVDRVLMRDGKAIGVEGGLVEPFTGRRTGSARFLARTVVLAAGVMGTPALCQKSGLTAPAIGSNLRMHPGTVVAGEFEQEVHPWYGATQGMHVLELLEYGIKLETLWADPALMAFRMPSIGARLKRQLQRYRNMATWDAWVSGEDSVGSVRVIPGAPRTSIRYDLGAGDLRRLQQATATLAEMFFAAGATKVYPGIHGLPQVLRSVDDIALIRGARIDHHDVPSGSNHVFGTMPMGGDPARSATDSHGAVWGVDGLYVCDTSLFPGSPAANPMLTLWAIAHKMGQELAVRT